ncbi:MAG: prepilin peptidase [Natronospirillum sp.]
METAFHILSLAAQGLTIILLIAIAAHDGRHFRIRNSSVLICLALYGIVQLATGFPDLIGDFIAGGLLFGIGFLFWLLRGLGAGDVKLMLPLGLHIGYFGLIPFGTFLTAVSILLFAAIHLVSRTAPNSRAGGWFMDMRKNGRVPYGIVLTFAALPVLVVKFLTNL